MEQQRLEDEATAALLNYQRHLQAMDEKLRTNEDEFECLICFTEVEAGEGVMLRECLHSFCRWDEFQFVVVLTVIFVLWLETFWFGE